MLEQRFRQEGVRTRARTYRFFDRRLRIRQLFVVKFKEILAFLSIIFNRVYTSPMESESTDARQGIKNPFPVLPLNALRLRSRP